MTDGPEEISIPLAGVDLKVVRQGAGRPLLMLHGGGGPLSGAPFAQKLAETFEVIAPVHPGFAGTPIPEHFDSLQDLVFLYLDLIDHLALDDAILMGFSMGGWTAMEIATLGRQEFSRLLLVASVGIKPGGREDRDIPDIFGISQDAALDLLWHDRTKAPDVTGMDDDQLAALAGNRTALAFYTWSPYMHNPKLPHRLHRVGMPTRLIWGESDGLVTPAYGQALCGMIPGAEMVTIAEAGHLPQLEQPGAFVDAVLAFAG